MSSKVKVAVRVRPMNRRGYTRYYSFEWLLITACMSSHSFYFRDRAVYQGGGRYGWEPNSTRQVSWFKCTSNMCVCLFSWLYLVFSFYNSFLLPCPHPLYFHNTATMHLVVCSDHKRRKVSYSLSVIVYVYNKHAHALLCDCYMHLL